MSSLFTMSPPLARRIGSALVLGPPTILCVYLGSTAFAVMVLVTMGILAWEWSRLCGAPLPQVGGVLLGCSLIAAIVGAELGYPAVGLLLLVAGGFAAYLVAHGNGWLAAGAICLGLPGVALVWLRQDPEMGRLVVLWLVAVVWASDIGAYAVGSTVGGPKLAPRISPRKTWSGLCGAITAAAAIGAAVAVYADIGSPLWVAVLSGSVGLAAQGGDLAESWLKRRFGVKDVSGLIPGHGGLLDRVDALLAAALLTALIAIWGNGKIWIWL
ncbi:MAG: phosphatidate cytidylyltransferase [Rhodospirillales bacterium]|nr:phosphatidate cytidylyltransferase [Rhodospirillales bacterium]